MRQWNDTMKPATEYLSWFEGRRIVRNTFGPLGDGRLAPDDCLRRVPAQPSLPVNVPEELEWVMCIFCYLAEATDCYRDYLAMTVAVDDMLGAILQRLQRDDLLDGTIVVFGSDHGSYLQRSSEYLMMGAHGLQPWQKRTPWEESVSVPLLVRLPRGRRAGSTCDALVAPEDLAEATDCYRDYLFPPCAAYVASTRRGRSAAAIRPLSGLGGLVRPNGRRCSPTASTMRC